MDNKVVKIVIQAVLGILIVVLFWWLVKSINDPWKEVEREAEITQMTRDQLAHVRTALVYYEQREDRFPSSLDSLMTWLVQDSLIQANTDSVFGIQDFTLDSLFYSPRTGARFEYTLNDTGRVSIYLLEDPDSEDHIGSSTPDVTVLNAASWE